MVIHSRLHADPTVVFLYPSAFRFSPCPVLRFAQARSPTNADFFSTGILALSGPSPPTHRISFPYAHCLDSPLCSCSTTYVTHARLVTRFLPRRVSILIALLIPHSPLTRTSQVCHHLSICGPYIVATIERLPIVRSLTLLSVVVIHRSTTTRTCNRSSCSTLNTNKHFKQLKIYCTRCPSST